MTQLPLSNILTGAGMACIVPHRGELGFFFNRQRGDVQTISKLLTSFWRFEVNGRDLYTFRSLVYQIDSRVDC
jgi:hypothetical protein